jgi:hypothetical protein
MDLIFKISLAHFSSCKLKGSLYGSLLYKEGANKTLKINSFSVYPLPVVPKGVA